MWGWHSHRPHDLLRSLSWTPVGVGPQPGYIHSNEGWVAGEVDTRRAALLRWQTSFWACHLERTIAFRERSHEEDAIPAAPRSALNVVHGVAPWSNSLLRRLSRTTFRSLRQRTAMPLIRNTAAAPCPRPRPPPAPDDRGHLRRISPPHVDRSAAGAHVDRTKSRTQFLTPSLCSVFATYPPRSLLCSQDLNQSANATSVAAYHRTAQDRPPAPDVLNGRPVHLRHSACTCDKPTVRIWCPIRQWLLFMYDRVGVLGLSRQRASRG